MKINKEVTVKISEKELEGIIIDHLKSKGVNVKSINFSVNGYRNSNDSRSMYALEYRLDEVICKGVEN